MGNSRFLKAGIDTLTFLINPLKFVDPNGEIWVYHYLNKDHTQIGLGWVDGKKAPKGYQILPFSANGIRVMTLQGGRQLAILRASSPVAQLASTTSSQSSNGDTVPNPSLMQDFSRRTAPMPRAVGSFAALSVVGGYLAASSPLNAAAYIAYALHEQSRADAVYAANTQISMDDAIGKAVDHVGPNGVMETTKGDGGGNFQFRSMGTDVNGQPEVRIGRFDINPNNSHVQSDGPHLNLETQGANPSNPHIRINPTTIRPGDYPIPEDIPIP